VIFKTIYHGSGINREDEMINREYGKNP